MTDGDGRGLIGGIASDLAAGLKQNPSCLAAILLAALFAFLTYHALTGERQEAHERAMAIIAKCFPNGTPPAAE